MLNFIPVSLLLLIKNSARSVNFCTGCPGPCKPSGFYKFVVLGLLQFILLVTLAQQPYSLVHYDENTLPQTTVGNIQQDENGYLWMNTQFGIVRFDGETVRVFTTANLKGLTSNRIRICAKGLDKSVYFVDENNVVVKVISPNRFEINATTDYIKAFRLPLYCRESNNDFTCLQFDKKAGYRQLVDSLKLDLTRELLKSYATGTADGYFFYTDLQQKVRLCYYNGTHYTSKEQSELFKPQHTFKLNNLIFSQSGSTEAFQFKKTNQPQHIKVSGLPAHFTGTFNMEAPVLFSNESGAFFYASGKLYQYQLKDRGIAATLLFDNLPCTGVVNVMKERTTGDFLISTKSSGFYRIKKKQFGVIDITGTAKEPTNPNNGISNNIVYAINLWDQQHILSNGYITPVTRTSGNSRYFDPGNKRRFNFFFQYTKDDQYFWLNVDDGIYSFHKETGRYTPLLKILDPKKAVEFSDGTTIFIAGHNIVALKNTMVTELYRNDSISFTTAEKIEEDCIAIGTANGLYYYYPQQNRLQAIGYKEALKVRCIYKDRSGRLWLTTYGQGLFYLSGNSIIPLPVDHAGYLTISHSIVEDDNGHFWVPTNHGLFKLDYASLLSIIGGKSSNLSYKYYDKTDGFNTNEFNGGCYPSSIYQKETGLVFLPSMNGIVKFNPDSIQNITSNSAVFIDKIVLNDTGQVYDVKGKIVFPSQTSSLRIDFSSPFYEHAENIKFSYTLSNAPEQWKDLQRSRSIVLNNLPGGSYTLTIKKEGANSPPILSVVDFQIRKKIFETLLFKILLLVLVIALVYLYFRARLYYLSKERKRLEKVVAVKTADQVKLIEQLKGSIARLTHLQQELEQMIGHKENVIAVLIHDIKSPLYFLNTVATHLHKGIDSNPPEKNKEIAKEIATSLSRLYLFTQDFATWLNASQPGQVQKQEKVDLGKIIEEALSVYKEIIDKKNIHIRNHTDAKLVYGDEPMIKSVLRNLIDNAVKNASGNTITISTKCPPDKQACEIIIADEGKGMTEEQIAALNHYFQHNDHVLPFTNSGFGHKVIKNFLQKLGGTIYYRQNQVSGIIVTVTLPVINLVETEPIQASQA